MGSFIHKLPAQHLLNSGANFGGDPVIGAVMHRAVQSGNQVARGPIQGPWAGSVPTFANAAAGYLPPGGAVPTAQHPYLGVVPPAPGAAPKVTPQPVMGGQSLGSQF